MTPTLTPHDKIGLIIAATLLTVLFIIFISKIVTTIKEVKQAKNQDDDRFNDYMNNYQD